MSIAIYYQKSTTLWVCAVDNNFYYMIPIYNLDDIKFGVDNPTFTRAVGLYEGGNVTEFNEEPRGYSAVVLGTHPYQVSVSALGYDRGSCDCYLGQRDALCKHMIAVALYAVFGGEALSTEDKEVVDYPTCSGAPGELSKEELAATKKSITSALRYIKPYNGPSRIWFAYQNSLDEGCARLSKLVSNLPVSEQTAKLLVDLLLRLERKVCGSGVDDSNGTVSSFMYEVVEVLKEYAELDPVCIKSFKKLCGRETCFGWEEPLVRMFDEQ